MPKYRIKDSVSNQMSLGIIIVEGNGISIGLTTYIVSEGFPKSLGILNQEQRYLKICDTLLSFRTQVRRLLNIILRRKDLAI